MAKKSTTSIKIFIDDREAGKSLRELRERYKELKDELQDPASGKSVEALQREFQRVAEKIEDSEKTLKKFREAGDNKFTLQDNIARLKQEFAEAGDNVQLAVEKMKLLRAEQAKLDRMNKIMSGDPTNLTGQNIAAVQKEVRSLNMALRNQLIPGTKEYEEALKRLAIGKQILGEHRDAIRAADEALRNTAQSGSFNELKKKYDELEKEINDLTIGTERYAQKTKELNQIGRRIDAHEKQVKGIGGAWNAVAGEIRRFGIIAMGALGLNALTNQVSNLTQRSAELSDYFANVSRVTDLTMEGVRELYNEFKDFNTRTPRTELLELAEAAGKLGITGKKDLRSFVKEADKIKVVLGKDLGEGAIKQIAKLTTVFNIMGKESVDIGEAMRMVGNTINQLGNTSTAAEANITDFTFRLGGIAVQAGMSIDQVAALGSTVDQLGLTTEVSSTSLSQVITRMFTNTEVFARIAGVELTEFNKILKEDSMEALTLFFEGLNESSDGLGEMAEMMKDVQINGVRGMTVITALANKTHVLRDALAVANKEYKTGNSLQDEFNKRNENFAGSLERVRRKIGEAFMNSRAIKGIQDMVIWIDKSTKSYEGNVRAIKSEITELGKLEVQLLDTNTPQEERVKIIKSLQDKYPNFLKNIDAEKVKNRELRDALKEVNTQLLNRLFLAREEAREDLLGDKLLDVQEKIYQQEERLRESMVRYASTFGVKIPEGDGLIDQATKLTSAIKGTREYREFVNEMSRYGIVDPIKDLNKQMSVLNKTTDKTLASLENQLEALRKRRAEFAKRWGLDLEETVGVTGDDEGDDFEEEVSTTLDGVEAKFQDFADRISKIRRQLALDAMTSNERELESIRYRYDDEIAIIEKAKEEVMKSDKISHKRRVELMKQYNSDIAELEALFSIEYNMAIERQAEKARAEFQKKMDQDSKERMKEQEKFIADGEKVMQEITELGMTENEKQRQKIEKHYDNLEQKLIEYYEKYLQHTGDFADEYQQAMDQIALSRLEALTTLDDDDDDDEFEVAAHIKELGEAGRLTFVELSMIKKKLIEDFGEEQGRLIFEEFFKGFSDAREEFLTNLIDTVGLGTEAMIDMFRLLGAEGERAAGFQKSLAFFEIATQSAVAMAHGVKAAMAHGATVWDRIAGAISAVAALTTMFSRFRSTLSSEALPKYAGGGFTGSGTYTDETGHKVAGIVHANEYVVPAWMRTVPGIPNMLEMIESIRTSRRYDAGGDVTAVAPSSTTSQETNIAPIKVESATDAELLELLRDLKENGVSIAYDKLLSARDRLRDIDPSSN